MSAPDPDDASTRKLGLVISGIITLAGLALLAAAMIVGMKSYQYSANAVKTQATVTEMVRRGRVRYPRYEYVVDGVSYTAMGGFGSNPPTYQTGDTIEIEHVRDRPADSRIASWGDRWFLTLWLSFVGGFLTAVGLAFRRKSAVTTERIDDGS